MGIIRNIFSGNQYSLKNYPKQEIVMGPPELTKYLDHRDLNNMHFLWMVQQDGPEAVMQYFKKYIEPRISIYREIFTSGELNAVLDGSLTDHPIRKIANDQINYFRTLVTETSWGFKVDDETFVKAGAAIGTMVIDGYACALTEKLIDNLPVCEQMHLTYKTPCKIFLVHTTSENWRGEPGRDLRSTRPDEENIDDASQKGDLLPPIGGEPRDSYPIWQFCRYFVDTGFYNGCFTMR